MKFCIFFSALVLVLNVPSSLSAAVQSIQPDSNQSETQKVFSILNKLFAALYDAAIKNQSDNIALSLFSINYLLIRLHLGANDTTNKYFDGSSNSLYDNSVIEKRWDKIIDNINDLKHNDFFILFKLYLSTQDYSEIDSPEITQTDRETEIENLSFINDQSYAQKMNNYSVDDINRIVNGLIEVVDNGHAQSLFRLDSYLIGRFINPFNATLTQSGAFYGNENSEEQVQYMFQEGEFNHGYVERFNFLFVELPFKDQKLKASLSLYIVVPHQYNESFMNDLRQLNFSQLPINITSLSLKVPKFEIKKSFNLKPTLGQKISVIVPKNDFDDYDGYMRDTNFKLDHVSQRTRIQVSEQGCDIFFSSAVKIVPVAANESSDNRSSLNQPLNKPLDQLSQISQTQIQSSANESPNKLEVNRRFFVILVEKYSGEQIFIANVIHPSRNV